MKSEIKQKQGYVNKDPYFMVPKLLYFLLNWLVYSPHGFIYQFMKPVWGLSITQLSVGPFFQIFNFFGSMFWGYWADRTRKYKLIAAFCVAVNTLFVCAQAFPCFSGNFRFTYFLFLTAAQCFFSAGTFPMIDAIVLSVLEADPEAGKDYYGSQKVFGTVAHNVTTWFIHKFYDMFGQDFFVMYYSAIVSMFALVCTLLYGIPDNLKIKAHKHHGPAAKKATELDDQIEAQGNSVWGLLSNLNFAIFLFSILAAGIVRSVNTNNHSIYLTDVLKLDKAILGDLMIWGRMIPEILLLFYAKAFMVHLGPYWFLILGQAAGVIRIILYLVLKPYESDKLPLFGVLVFIEMLKGVNSSMVSAGAFRIASDLAPPAWSGSAQTLVGGFWQGISMAFAAAITSGMLFIIGGGDDSLYYVFAFTGLLGVVSFGLIFFHYSITDNKLFAKKK